MVESVPPKQKSRLLSQDELDSTLSFVDFTQLNDQAVLQRTSQSIKLALGRLLPQLEQCESPVQCAQIAAAIASLVSALNTSAI